VGVLREPETGDPLEAGRIERAREAAERQGLVEPQPEHHPLARAGGLVDLLELPLGPRARRDRREVPAESRRGPPPPVLDCADCADPEPEVVVTEPVAEVVPRAQIALVVDALEVVLHRVGLPRELRSPGLGEARSRLRLELVAGEMLRRERERVAEIRL